MAAQEDSVGTASRAAGAAVTSSSPSVITTRVLRRMRSRKSTSVTGNIAVAVQPCQLQAGRRGRLGQRGAQGAADAPVQLTFRTK